MKLDERLPYKLKHAQIGKVSVTVVGQVRGRPGGLVNTVSVYFIRAFIVI